MRSVYMTLNEYRTTELNVHDLKALPVVLEYVGPQSAYHCDSVVTMLEDACKHDRQIHCFGCSGVGLRGFYAPLDFSSSVMEVIKSM